MSKKRTQSLSTRPARRTALVLPDRSTGSVRARQPVLGYRSTHSLSAYRLELDPILVERIWKLIGRLREVDDA